jgi:gamma-glutamyltranspeptidase/glutathione hydrolase
MLSDAERIKADGNDENGKMPTYGWTPVTVPGAPKAWAELAGRFGRLSLAEDLAPAVRYAREGYPCAPNLANMWQRAYSRYAAGVHRSGIQRLVQDLRAGGPHL